MCRLKNVEKASENKNKKHVLLAINFYTPLCDYRNE